MARRFGRNQKRKMREQLAAAWRTVEGEKEWLAISVSMLNAERRNVKLLKREIDDAKRIAGRMSILFPPITDDDAGPARSNVWARLLDSPTLSSFDTNPDAERYRFLFTRDAYPGAHRGTDRNDTIVEMWRVINMLPTHKSLPKSSVDAEIDRVRGRSGGAAPVLSDTSNTVAYKHKSTDALLPHAYLQPMIDAGRTTADQWKPLGYITPHASAPQAWIKRSGMVIDVGTYQHIANSAAFDPAEWTPLYAHPSSEAATTREEIAIDRAWLDGLRQGWNFGATDDREGYKSARYSREVLINAARIAASEAGNGMNHTRQPKAPAEPVAWTDDRIRHLWRSNGGDFHGPHIETGTMPESSLLPFIRECLMMQNTHPPADVQRDAVPEMAIRDALEKFIEAMEAADCHPDTSSDRERLFKAYKVAVAAFAAQQAAKPKHSPLPEPAPVQAHTDTDAGVFDNSSDEWEQL